MNIAIVVIAYNRVDSVKRLLNSVSDAYYDEDDVQLIISIDKSNTDIVEKYADSFVWKHGNKIVDKHHNNLGLKKHIISLGKWFNQFDAIILLEDDLIVSPNYYRYAKQTIEKYKGDNNIAGISLYNFPINFENYLPFEAYKDANDVFFMKLACSWGEIWMKEQFADFLKWYNLNLGFDVDDDLPDALFNWGEKSWLRYYIKYCIKNNKYFVYPYYSLSTNFSEVGSNHASNNFNNPTVFQVQLQHGDVDNWKLPSFIEKAVKYDAFFNNEAIYKHLGLSKENCCLDLYGTKKYKGERYWLTIRTLNFSIVKSYSFNLRPVEENVFNNIFGDDLYLYDTFIKVNNSFNKKTSQQPYYYRIRFMPHFIMEYGCKTLFLEFLKGLVHKLRLVLMHH